MQSQSALWNLMINQDLGTWLALRRLYLSEYISWLLKDISPHQIYDSVAYDGQQAL